MEGIWTVDRRIGMERERQYGNGFAGTAACVDGFRTAVYENYLTII